MNDLKLTDNQLFKEWTDYLKNSFGISVAAIGKRIGLSKSQMNAYRNGPTKPSKVHFESLAEAFPELNQKASEFGLLANKRSIEERVDEIEKMQRQMMLQFMAMQKHDPEQQAHIKEILEEGGEIDKAFAVLAKQFGITVLEVKEIFFEELEKVKREQAND